MNVSTTFTQKPGVEHLGGGSRTPLGPGSRQKKVPVGVGKKGKGKAVVPAPEEFDGIDTDSEAEDFDKESEEEVKPRPCGRLQKDMLKDGAKRMKRS